MIDGYGRTIDYVRISVTDRCNLRCVYCMPEEGVGSISHEEILRFGEIERVCQILAENGIQKIKLTGGEPLVRRRLPELAAALKRIPGIKSLTITTNGVLLEEMYDALADAGFNVVTFAGNHCFDKKETGVTDTLRYFHETYPDITTLGIHDSEADAAVIPIVEKNGIRIAMLNFTYGLNNSMPEKRWMVDMLSSTDTVCGRIAQAKQEADFVIVFPHWGTEDELSPDESQLRWAQEMADAGADLIIGGHPHTLQPTGLLTAADGRDVPVYYSLGNFLSHQKEMINLLGGMASVTIVKDKYGTRVEEYELKPTINVILRDPASGWYDYRPMLLEDYTPELAAQNRFTDCTVEAMQTLYEDIVG